MARAYVCPGQGAQTIGMGRALSVAYPEAKIVFQEVDDALNENLSGLIWEGDLNELTLTKNAQPALMATSLAAFRALQSEGLGLDGVDYVAGHSLGEYSALAISGALSVADTARLLRKRGQAMQSAVPVGVGAMAAILGLDFAAVAKLAAEAAQGDICQAANDNDPGQVVVSGHVGAVERAITLAKEAGAKRALLLPVSAPFHCDLMAPAAAEMAQALSTVAITAPKVPLVCNVKAAAVSAPEQIRELLFQQITASVRWRESVQWMVEQQVSEIWEIGAGKALTGMVRRIDRAVACRNIATPDDISAAINT